MPCTDAPTQSTVLKPVAKQNVELDAVNAYGTFEPPHLSLPSPDTVMAKGMIEPPGLSLPSRFSAQEPPCGLLFLDAKAPFHSPLLLGCLGVAIVLLAIDTLAWLHAFASEVWAPYVEADAQTLCGVMIAGFVAQLVDGALGMGYGLTSSTVLVAAGLSPRTASGVVHLAQLGTTLVSGLAHHRIGTTDGPTAWRIAIPGVVGALVGASLLSSLPVATAKSMASALLLGVGAYLFQRYCRQSPSEYEVADAGELPLRAALLAPIGLLGGFIDVAGGGGWGPVATSGLLAEGRLPPSKVVGTVCLSEFFVTVAAVGGFLALSSHGDQTEAMRLDLMLTLLVGGLMAAPLAPLLVTKLAPDVLGAVVGGFICVTNARALLQVTGVTSEVRSAWLAVMALVWVAGSGHVAWRRRVPGVRWAWYHCPCWGDGQ